MDRDKIVQIVYGTIISTLPTVEYLSIPSHKLLYMAEEIIYKLEQEDIINY